VCSLCREKEEFVPLPHKQAVLDPYPGGCLKKRYVPERRQKECPACHKTRDNLPSDNWKLLLPGSSRYVSVKVCEWCDERMAMQRAIESGEAEEPVIFHGGCDCDHCGPYWLALKEERRLLLAEGKDGI